MSRVKVVLFIPCYNVVGSVVAVLNRIPQPVLDKLDHIFLIDNGSVDGTRAALKDFVSRAPRKFRLLLNEENYSLGGSTIIAIRESIDIQADFLICLHSDGQAQPEDLQKFFPLSTELDFVFGSRMLPGSVVSAYSRLRWYGNFFFAKLQQLILGQKIFDIGAFVALNLRTIRQFPYYRIKPDMSYFPALVLYVSTQKKIRCLEFPITWDKVRASEVNIWRYGLAHLYRLLQFAFGSYRLTDGDLGTFRTIEWRPTNEALIDSP